MIVGMGMGCKGKGGKVGKGDQGLPLLHPQLRSEVGELRSEVAELRAEVAELRVQLQWTFRALDRQLPLMPDTATPAPTPDTATGTDGKGLKRQRT